MSWIEALPPFGVAVLLLFAPGAPIAAALGARGAPFLALSVGSSVSAIAVGTVVAPVVGLDWSLAVPFLVAIPLAAIGWGLRRAWLRFGYGVARPARRRFAWRGTIAALIGTAIGGTLILASVARAIGDPRNQSQTYDSVFHLNAIRWIAENGVASPFGVTVSTPDSGGAFYPTVWHSIGAIAYETTQASVVVTANATALAVAAFVWPIAALFLVERILGRRTATLIAAGILSAAFAAFPYLLVEFGVLYPNLLGTALVPLALGALHLALNVSRSGMEPPARWLTFVWLLPGVALAHPNAAFSLAVVAAPLVTWGIIRALAHAAPDVRRRAAIAYITTAVVIASGIAFAWMQARPTDTFWTRYQSIAQAFGELALTAPRGRTAAFALAALILIGFLIAIRRRSLRWMVASYSLTALLYVSATAWVSGPLRDAITALWYNDSFRVAALIPLMGVPLATLGAISAYAWLRRRIPGSRIASARPFRDRPRRLSVGVAVVGIIALLVLTQDQTIRNARGHIAAAYRPDRTTAVVSEDELAMFEEVERLVPEGEVVAGNPWNGSGLVYAYAGRPALFAHVGGVYGDERWLIAEELDDIDPEVCDALADLEVTYLLDFGTDYVFDGDARAERYPAFDDPDELADEGILEEVARRGDAVLYRITACA